MANAVALVEIIGRHTRTHKHTHTHTRGKALVITPQMVVKMVRDKQGSLTIAPLAGAQGVSNAVWGGWSVVWKTYAKQIQPSHPTIQAPRLSGGGTAGLAPPKNGG